VPRFEWGAGASLSERGGRSFGVPESPVHLLPSRGDIHLGQAHLNRSSVQPFGLGSDVAGTRARPYQPLRSREAPAGSRRQLHGELGPARSKATRPDTHFEMIAKP